MDRLTEVNKGIVVPKLTASCNTHQLHCEDCDCEVMDCKFLRDALNRLAAYEDTGLTPEEIIVVKNIVGRIATADYPHNFQHERADIVTYMYWITSVMKDAKEWWNSMATQKGE